MKFNKILPIILLIITIFSCSPFNNHSKLIKKNSFPQYKQKHKTKYDFIKNKIFRIVYKDKTLGTAYLYKLDNKVYLITASHTLEGLEDIITEIYLQNEDMQLNLKNIINPDPRYDISLLFIKDDEALYDLKYFEHYLDVTDYKDILVFNYSSFPPKVIENIILSKGYVLENTPDSHNFYAYLNIINKGGSGSPVLIKGINKIAGMITDRIIDPNNENYIGLVNVLSIKKIDEILINFSSNRDN